MIVTSLAVLFCEKATLKEAIVTQIKYSLCVKFGLMP